MSKCGIPDCGRGRAAERPVAVSIPELDGETVVKHVNLCDACVAAYNLGRQSGGEDER